MDVTFLSQGMRIVAGEAEGDQARPGQPAAPAPAARRFAMVGAYRPSEVELAYAAAGNRPHPLQPLIYELRLRLGPIQIDLGRFEPEFGRRFVDALLDQDPNRLPDSFRVALFWCTKGYFLL